MGAKVSKRYLSHSFGQISNKPYNKYVSHGGILGYYFFGDRSKIKIFMALFWNFFVNIGPYGAGNFKTILLLQFSSNVMSANLDEDIGYHGGIQAITFLGNRSKFENFVAL